LAIIPIRGQDKEFAGELSLLASKPLMSYTFDAVRKSQYITKTIVSTDRADIQRQAESFGMDVPFLRPPELSGSDVSLDHVLQHCVRWLEEHQEYVADVVVLLEITHPVREDGLIDRVVDTLLKNDLDSVFVAHEERHSFWTSDAHGTLSRVGEEEYAPRHLRKPIYREMSGLACATRAKFVRAGSRLGQRVGLVPIHGPSAIVDTHDENGLWLAKKILELSQ
jgi:CMP-N-acetylneuraminic acid synthetase